MTDKRTLLIECYRSGQISEAAWQQHLREDPKLAADVAALNAIDIETGWPT